jgi:hypothetical protein
VAIIGRRTEKPVNWLATGLQHARRVGRLELREGTTQGPLASGFLLDGGQLTDEWAGLPLFMTAGHAVADRPGSQIFSVREAFVIFEGMFADESPDVTAQPVEVVAVSPVDHLDFALLLLDRWPGQIDEVKFAPKPPGLGELVYIFSYPQGGGLAVSLVDNEIVEPGDLTNAPHARYEDRIFYRAPTRPGASGAPVFNEFWEIIAIHLAGYPRIGNCGVLIQQVIEEARRQLNQKPAPPLGRRQVRSSESAMPVTPQERTSHPPAAPPPEVPAPTPAVQRSGGARYQSVFISYSRQDSTFANRLHTALESKGIRAWLDKYNILPGADVNDEIAKAVLQRDKVLLCCSRASLKDSWWVDRELNRVFDKEQRIQKRQGKKILALIPLDLDGYLFDEWEGGKADLVRARAAVDFKGWEDEAKFDGAFAELMRGLKKTPGRRRKSHS